MLQCFNNRETKLLLDWLTQKTCLKECVIYTFYFGHRSLKTTAAGRAISRSVHAEHGHKYINGILVEQQTVIKNSHSEI